MADVKVELVSAACNRNVNAASWGACGLVAFASHNAVALFSPEKAAIVATLPGHKDHVNCVEWVAGEERYLLSGSADGHIVLWEFNQMKEWRLACQISMHEKSVTCISTIELSSGGALAASSSSDGTVRIWKLELATQAGGDCSISSKQTISVGSKVMVAVSMAYLPGNPESIVLAMGGLDHNIHLYVCNSLLHKFVTACKLKGHEEWIRGLDFSRKIQEEDGKDAVFLASASQDRRVRIWKISLTVPVEASTAGVSLKAFIEGPIMRVGENSWQVSLESLLIGHEDWVYSVCWQPNDGTKPLSVLSASMDKAMMIWRVDTKSGVWMNEVTVGELGHSALGFYGGIWSPNGDSILAHGFNGSFHLWKEINSEWLPQLAPSGHFGSVVDIGWAKSGQFLISASHDQTTRIFAKRKSGTWHEIARPQIHGHDINCLAVVRGKGNHRYVSGAEEKVARVFEAPTAFLDTVTCITSGESFEESSRESLREAQILGANMSALGLSQKPIYKTHGVHGNANMESKDGTFESMETAAPSVTIEPALEGHLAQNTLWPELHKLYGHGNELFAMACDHSGQIVATACKAQSANVAEIWVWETSSWRAIAQLHSHTLTITQMEFSHDDNFLLSVSRDRHFSIFSKNQSGGYDVVAKVEGHKRIIWGCSWSRSDKYFVTGSRDKSVKVWSAEGKECGVMGVFGSSVNAVAWGGVNDDDDDDVVAVGMESGMIELWKCLINKKEEQVKKMEWEWRCLHKFDVSDCHVSCVNRLMWKENRNDGDGDGDGDGEGGGDGSCLLASCGSDHAIRIYNITLL